MPIEILHDPTTRHHCPDQVSFPIHYDHKGTKGWYVVNGRVVQIKFCPFCGEDLERATQEAIANAN